MISRETCRQRAAAIGPATAALVERLLEHRPEDRLRSAGRVLALAREAGEGRRERAGARALAYGNEDYPTIKRILAAGLDAAPPLLALPPHPMPAARAVPTPRIFTFVRPASEFAASLAGARR